MKFLDLYKNLESTKGKRQLRNEIVSICRVQPSSFYSWKRRNSFPPLIMEKISELLKIPEPELFPEAFLPGDGWDFESVNE